MGDAYGASYEGGPVERLLWKIIGRTLSGKIRYTDDTQMSIDVATSFLKSNGINQEHLATTFAENYRWSRGYGRTAARLLKKIKNGSAWKDVNRAAFIEGSYGNGAAMRAPVISMCFPDNLEILTENVVRCSEITHAHPLAIEGARLVAFATHVALHDWENVSILKALPGICRHNEYRTKMSFCIESVQAKNPVSIKTITSTLGNGIAASQSCVTAIYFALRYRNQSFQSMRGEIYGMGGDTDTIGAMAGAIWGAFNGSSSMDRKEIERIENREAITALAQQLHVAATSSNAHPVL